MAVSGAGGAEAGMGTAPQVRRIARFGLTTPDARRLAAFYEAAFGARQLSREWAEGADFRRVMGVDGGAWRVTLRVGAELLELLEFARPGAPYPPDLPPYQVAFQHFALVVGDMALAMHRLAQSAGWTALSVQGPQHLPQRSGGVTAFKLRDPDGHPLELLEFSAPKGRATGDAAGGIDHSALSVADPARSVAFFHSLGCTVAHQGWNQGPEQERLDGVADPHVEVVALAPPCPRPHLELLGYRTNAGRGSPALRCNDVAATRIVLEADTGAERIIADPDGHRLHLIPEFRQSGTEFRWSA
jgi:catechol 2,3-dioxygenase-like lactoylglutathione lyase family enzyme